ncbi:hypothetical protein Ddye_011888 [Dipteronia dyeriana]|uniref:Uncharacterized protein n=1 Tax=Dipteronia dyeriana TaxID=168575 RepID=A0AAE0CHV0_9ROSI|nr:hypothetical protein Ddye_011888 [Dipteronia dyeriana]
MTDNNNTNHTSIAIAEPTKNQETAPTFSSKKLKKEEDPEPETTPEFKRRKTCPISLDKIQEITLSNASSSFTFDTKLINCAPDHITPKFGSFNHHVVSNQVKKKNHLLLNDCEDKEEDEQREED